MTPDIYLLSGHAVALCNLRHCSTAHTDRAHDRKLIVINPPTTPLDPLKISSYMTPPRIIGVIATPRQAVTVGRLQNERAAFQRYGYALPDLA